MRMGRKLGSMHWNMSAPIDASPTTTGSMRCAHSLELAHDHDVAIRCNEATASPAASPSERDCLNGQTKPLVCGRESATTLAGAQIYRLGVAEWRLTLSPTQPRHYDRSMTTTIDRRAAMPRSGSRSPPACRSARAMIVMVLPAHGHGHGHTTAYRLLYFVLLVRWCGSPCSELTTTQATSVTSNALANTMTARCECAGRSAVQDLTPAPASHRKSSYSM